MRDRRKTLRVMDAIGLEIQHDMSGSDKPSPKSSPGRVQNHYDLAGYAEVKRQYPAITEYIDTLEERIRQLRLDGRELPEAPTHKVILSAGGVAFAEDRLFQPGDIVTLHITLFPKLQHVVCEGAVVSIGDITEVVHDNQHSYRVSFTSISDADARVIDRHVHSLCKSIRSYPES